jgi:hypothetical protein
MLTARAGIKYSIMTVPAQADGRDAPQPNPYAPPRADVADVSQKSSATTKKSLLPLWLAASYCIIIGACHVVMLVLALYRAWDMVDEGLLPGSAYAFGFIQPAARLAAGFSFIRRSKLSPVFFVALTAFTAIFPILWQRYWNSQTGYAFRPGPLSFLVIADLLVLLAITRYAFALKSRGMLK